MTVGTGAGRPADTRSQRPSSCTPAGLGYPLPMPFSRRLPGAVLLGALLTPVTSCVAVDRTAVPSTPGAAPSATASPVPVDEATAAGQEMSRAVFDRVNAERAARDLPAPAWDEGLAAAARGWNAEMATRETLEHQDIGALLDRPPLQDLAGIGENVFRATGPVPAGTVHAGWMRADDHRVNVLNPGWDRVGVAVLCAADGSVWATQEFGRRAAVDLPPVAEEVPSAQPLVRPEDDGPRCD